MFFKKTMLNILENSTEITSDKIICNWDSSLP